MRLTPFVTPRELASLLNVSYKYLLYVLYDCGPLSRYYNSFSIPKKNGGERIIFSPNDQLKNLQYRLKELLDEIYKPHAAAYAFISGKSILDNAKNHVKKKYVFNVDLKDFYGSIHFGRVRGLLINKPYSLSNETASLIAHISCLNGSLPQGAPTSTTIANMACRRLDRELSLLAKESKATYSRYADDITFSLTTASVNSFYKEENGQIAASDNLEQIIKANGFSLNETKTRLQSNKDRQVVTGLIVNKKVNLDRRFVRKTRAMIFDLHKGVEKANQRYYEIIGKVEGRLENVVLGRLLYIHMIKGRDSEIYQSLANNFNKLNIDVRAPVGKKLEGIKQALLFKDPYSRGLINSSVWVVEIPHVSDPMTEVQGTAFMTKNNILITCHHLLEKASSPNSFPKECTVYLADQPQNKYKANVIKTSKDFDLTQLHIEGSEPGMFRYLDINDVSIHHSYHIALAGFPQKMLGHKSVTIIPTVVTNTFVRSRLDYFEVNHTILSGHSGGPALDANCRVLGIVTMGTSFKIEGKDVVQEGNNCVLSIKHIIDFLS